MQPALAVVLSFLCVALAFADNQADFDPSFGGDGTVIYVRDVYDEWPTDIVTSADNEVYVAAIIETTEGVSGRRPAVFKFTASGEIDPDFANGWGYFVVPADLPGDFRNSFVDIELGFGGDDSVIYLSFPSDSGTPASKDFFLARIKGDGSGLDTPFGLLGLTSASFDLTGDPNDPGDDLPYDLAMRSDGVLCLAGSVERAGTNMDMGVACFNSSGSLESSFSGDGKLVVSFDLGGDNRDQANGIGFSSSGNLNVVGSATTTVGWDLAVAVIDPDGNLDTGFSGDGKGSYRYLDVGNNLTSDDNVGWSVVAFPELPGQFRLYIGGASRDPSVVFGTWDAAVFCVDPDGAPCSAFGSQGWTLIDFSDNSLTGIGDTDDWVKDLSYRSDDGSLSLVCAVKQVLGSGKTYPGVARVSYSSGTLKTGFGTAGKRYYAEPSDWGLEVSGTLDTSGRELIAGEVDAVTYDSSDVEVIRLGGAGIFSDDFESGGTLLWDSTNP